MRSALLTGGAGFIGSHVLDRLITDGWNVAIIDNFDTFYSRSVKLANIADYRDNPRFTLIEADIRDFDYLRRAIQFQPDVVIHCAARAGVRPSLTDPGVYESVNVTGTRNLLEISCRLGVKQFIFASSSSVYGNNHAVPWTEGDQVCPISPYAVTKVTGELLGHMYSHLHGIRFVALRLFTVYGPRQRPDLAIHKFTDLLLQGKHIPLFGDGSTSRNYAYIDDIADGFIAAIGYDRSLYEVFNLAGPQAISLRELIRRLEAMSGAKARIANLECQPGDAPLTLANLRKANALLGYSPRVSFAEGLDKFWAWYSSALTRQMNVSGLSASGT